MSYKPSLNGHVLGDYDLRPPQTKVVVSLQPSTDLQTIKRLLQCGMNAARIASAFGSSKELELLMNRIRDASTTTKRLCAIILETQGTSAMVGPVNHINANTPNPQKDNDEKTPEPSFVSRRHKKSKSLQSIAHALDVDLNNLPQHILENASFAVQNIMNDEQEKENENDNNDVDNSGSATPVKQTKREKPLMLPLEVTPKKAMEGNKASTGHTLSYDTEQFGFQQNIVLMTGSVVRIITDRIILGDRKKFSICFPGLCNKLTVGKHILIHPAIRLQVKSIDKVKKTLSCLVLNGGVLQEYSKVEFPSLTIKWDGDGITQQDVTDIGFGVQNHVDYICISKIKSVADIATAKEMVEFQAATIRNMKLKRNTSYELGSPRRKLLGDEHDIQCPIKVLAKIEDWKCIYNIYDIITESDGILIDITALQKSHAQYAEKNNEAHLSSEITETINKIMLEARQQAKPASICCEISSQLIVSNMNVNKHVFSEIEHDLKLLHNVGAGIPINPSNFLSSDDISSIERCVAYNSDSICIDTDFNRLKHIFTEYQIHHNTKKITRHMDRDDLLLIDGLFRSIEDIIKHKEKKSSVSNSRYYSFIFRKNSMAKLGSFASLNKLNLDECNDDDEDDDDDDKVEKDDDQSSNTSYSDRDEQRKIEEVETIFNSMASSAVKSAFDLNCSLIIVLTQSGRIARIVSKYRPHCIILAITDSEIIAKQCMLVSSVFPVLVLNMNGTDSLISRALLIANKYKLIKKKNEKVVVLAGTQSDILDEPCDFIMKYLRIDL